jgi:hypothetical protein
MNPKRPNQSDFTEKMGEDLGLDHPSVPEGYTLLVRSDDDEAFARELIVNCDVILLSVFLFFHSFELD